MPRKKGGPGFEVGGVSEDVEVIKRELGVVEEVVKKRKRGRPRKDEATRWKAGESGNPAGRPGAMTAAELGRLMWRRMSRARATQIIDALILKGCDGDLKAIDMLFNRMLGPLRQMVDVDQKVEMTEGATERVKSRLISIADRLTATGTAGGGVVGADGGGGGGA